MPDRRITAAIAASLLLLVAAPAAGADEAKLRVVATFSLLGDLVRQIGGDRVAVTSLVGPNGDAHVYEPTPADVQAVAAARLVVVNGLGFEGWIDRLIGASGFHGTRVTATDGVIPLDRGSGTGRRDPHAWQDLANGRIAVADIARGLAAIDPEHQALYDANARAYNATLAALDARLHALFAAIPAAQRRVVTTHDAFEYFGRAYGVEFLAVVGITTESEPSAGDVAKLIRLMKREHVRALFVENISDPRLVAQLAREADAVIGGKLYSDALSPPDGPAASYVAMFEHNAATLRAAMLRN